MGRNIRCFRAKQINHSINQSVNPWLTSKRLPPEVRYLDPKKYTPKHQDIRRYDWMSPGHPVNQIKSNQSTHTLILNLNQTNWYFNLHGSFSVFEQLHIGFRVFFQKRIRRILQNIITFNHISDLRLFYVWKKVRKIVSQKVKLKMVICDGKVKKHLNNTSVK